MQKILIILTTLLFLLITTNTLAQHIKLYAKPNDKAQVVASIASGKRLLPIYFPKQGDWIKVANPKNGQVGWVKFKDLSGHSSIPGLDGLTFHQKIISKKQGKHGQQIYRVITYQGNDKLTPSEVKAMVKQMQRRIKHMQIQMSQMTQHMMYDMENFQHTDAIHFDHEIDNFSLLQPIIIIPNNHQKAATHTINKAT